MIEKLAPPVAARLQELEEMAARLLALARKLPPGQRRYDIMQEIGRFRVRIAALKGPELGRSHRGPKAKGNGGCRDRPAPPRRSLRRCGFRAWGLGRSQV